MDERMAAQEHVALAWSLFDLYNNRQSDPAWLDKCMAAFAADAETFDVLLEQRFVVQMAKSG